MPRRRKRLDASSFELPVEELRRGGFSHATAVWARDVLIADGRSPLVTVQFASEQSGLLGGIDEAIAVLKVGVEDWAPLCVGVLSRRTRVSTTARSLVEAARPKPVMTLPARNDHWLLQRGDAFAA